MTPPHESSRLEIYDSDLSTYKFDDTYDSLSELSTAIERTLTHHCDSQLIIIKISKIRNIEEEFWKTI